ncbi:MAG: hypothetical protein IJ869_00580 [Clostridiales bacterium]|nr:hypothetical protein [Clostridiales bacterium]
MKKIITKAASMASAAIIAAVSFAGFALKANTVNAAYQTPRLIVTGSEITTGDVNAGEEFQMVVHLKNESTATKLYNIRLEFASDDNEIYPVDGTNVVYVDSVDKEEEFDVTVDMATRGDLEQKPYTLNVNYEYEDNNRNTFEDASEIAVPVLQTPEISLSEMKLSKSVIDLDGKTSLSFKINNMGKGSVYNVMVEVNGERISDADTVVGNIEMGQSSNVDLSVKGISVGDEDIDVKVTYEDADGNSYETAKTVSLSVIEPVEEVVSEDAPAVNMTLVVAVVGAVILIIVISGVARKKKEKKYA